ncbi:MAG: glycosyltransferase family 2 protein [Chloroflexota bacterium]
MPPHLSIIIVTYNSAEVIEDCLRSIPQGWAADCSDGVCKPADTSNWDGSNVETIVVDNGSTDDTLKIISEKFKWVKVLSGQGNLMFSGGNNYGFKHAHAPFMFMLNPDTIVQAGALKKLVEFAQAHPEAGMIAPHTINPDESLQHNTFHFPDLKQAFFGFFEMLVLMDSPLNGRYLPEDYARVRDAEHILGATVFLRRELYEQMGGMDEKFELYFEETDWCYRAKKAGWKILYTPDATIIHLGAHSTSKNPELSSVRFYRTQSYFYRKNYGIFKYIALKFITVVGLKFWLARTLKGWVTKKIDNAKLKARVWSYWEILRA